MSLESTDLNELKSLLGCAIPWCGDESFTITINADDHIIITGEGDTLGNRYVSDIAPDGTVNCWLDYGRFCEAFGAVDDLRANCLPLLSPNTMEKVNQILNKNSCSAENVCTSE